MIFSSLVFLITPLVIGLITATSPPDSPPPPFLRLRSAQPVKTDQYAELFTSVDGTETYKLTADEQDSDNFVARKDEEEKPQKSTGFFEGFGESRAVSKSEKGQPLITEDRPAFVMPSGEVMKSREKRSMPQWQLAWRRRYEQYERRNGNAAPAESEGVLVAATSRPRTRKRTTTTAAPEVSQNKFARQFVPNDQQVDQPDRTGTDDDNNVVNGDDSVVVPVQHKKIKLPQVFLKDFLTKLLFFHHKKNRKK